MLNHAHVQLSILRVCACIGSNHSEGKHMLQSCSALLQMCDRSGKSMHFSAPKMKTDSRYWSLNNCQRWEIIAPSSSISYLYIHFLFLFSCQTDINLLSITFISHHRNFQGLRPAIRNLVAAALTEGLLSSLYILHLTVTMSVMLLTCGCCHRWKSRRTNRKQAGLEVRDRERKKKKKKERRDQGCLRCPVFQQEVTNSILSLAFKRLTPLITHYALRECECLCERDKFLGAAPQFKRGPTPNC